MNKGKIYINKKDEMKKQVEEEASTCASVTALCSHGVFSNNVNFKDDFCIDAINKKTAGIGTLIKPFTIISETARNNKLYGAAEYYEKLSGNIGTANHHLKKVTIADYLRYPILNAFTTAIGLLNNEFESLSEKLLKSLYENSYTFVNGMVLRFEYDISPDIIIEHIAEKVGYETLQAMYVNANTGTPEDDKKFRDIIIPATDPFISIYASDSAALLADFIYDKLYEEMLAELNSDDFCTVCEYIKPIILSFRDDIMKIGTEIIYNLIKYRLIENPHQISERINKYEDTDILF